MPQMPEKNHSLQAIKQDRALKIADTAKLAKNYKSSTALNNMLVNSLHNISSNRYRILLYRFLTDNIPLVNACISTWVRLAASPGSFKIISARDKKASERAESRLSELSRKIHYDALDNSADISGLLLDLFRGMFRDGCFGGFITVDREAQGVDKFIPVENTQIFWDEEKKSLFLEAGERKISLKRPDFYYLTLGSSPREPLGRSILKAVPFISYIEQQLVDDMRRSTHKSGYQRLHVKITPPERMAGEADDAYTERINNYFDATVRMIRDCEVDDNPVTWDNVDIAHVGPENSRSVTNSWFMNHRAMIEDICAGTNLAPYLLGYSYGATTTWSNFKFDVVMRQVRSVQAEVAHFLRWLGQIDLALGNIEADCEYVFDNTMAYQAQEQALINSGNVENLLKLYQAGLIDEARAREIAGDLL